MLALKKRKETAPVSIHPEKAASHALNSVTGQESPSSAPDSVLMVSSEPSAQDSPLPRCCLQRTGAESVSEVPLRQASGRGPFLDAFRDGHGASVAAGDVLTSRQIKGEVGFWSS